MSAINDNYLRLEQRYLFAEVAARVAAFCQRNPSAEVIRMGIGDVTQPIVPAVVEAMHKAVEDLACAETFRGYGPEPGYDFLREAIVANDYAGLGIKASEIFVSDGAKSDTGNIGDIFSESNVIGITDPVYPVYVDTNTMAGRRIVFIPCNQANGFTGDIPDERLDIAAAIIAAAINPVSPAGRPTRMNLGKRVSASPTTVVPGAIAWGV